MTSRRLPWGLWLFALAMLGVFLVAGTWQWQRGLEKDAMLAAQARTIQEREPVALATAREHPERLEWAAGTGRFPDVAPVYLDNQRNDGRQGVRVYRVFEVDDADATQLLVELGWLPLPADRGLPVLPDLAPGEHPVRGLLMPPPSAGLSLGEALQRQPDGSLLALRVVPAEIAAALGLSVDLAPRVLRLDPALDIGFERDLDVLANTLPPEKHRGYAVQWFGLAAATLVITLVLSFRRRRQ
nr:SURF1 family protein [Alkalisalibacterium limincola]